jgi:molecular chaperone DnaK
VRLVDREAAATGPSADGDAGASDTASVTDDAVRAVAAQTGLEEDDLRNAAKRTVINVLPKAVGIKLIDRSKPGWEEGAKSAYYVEHLVDAQTQLPFLPGRTYQASTVVANQDEIEIEIWEQAGASPSPDMQANSRVEEGSSIKGLASYALPAGSPVNIIIGVDEEGTVSLKAIEPTSGKELQMSVRISILTAEQVAEAKQAHSALTVST